MSCLLEFVHRHSEVLSDHLAHGFPMPQVATLQKGLLAHQIIWALVTMIGRGILSPPRTVDLT